MNCISHIQLTIYFSTYPKLLSPASTPFESGRSSRSSRVLLLTSIVSSLFQIQFLLLLLLLVRDDSFYFFLTHTLLAIADGPAFLYFIEHVVFLFSISSSSSSYSDYNEYSRIICLVFRSLSRSSGSHTHTHHHHHHHHPQQRRYNRESQSIVRLMK